MNRGELVEYIFTGPPRMNEAGWYLLLGFFIMIWMWLFIWTA